MKKTTAGILAVALGMSSTAGAQEPPTGVINCVETSEELPTMVVLRPGAENCRVPEGYFFEEFALVCFTANITRFYSAGNSANYDVAMECLWSHAEEEWYMACDGTYGNEVVAVAIHSSMRFVSSLTFPPKADRDGFVAEIIGRCSV